MSADAPKTSPETTQPTTLEPLRTAHTPEQVLERVGQRARRGKLPGFEHAPSGADWLFSVTDVGTPFEGRVLVHAARDGDSTELRFESKLKPTLPAVFAILLLVTIWPGVWMTDSLLVTYFSWYRIETWWWYLPLTIPFVPFAWRKAIAMSRASILREALERRDLIEESLAEA